MEAVQFLADFILHIDEHLGGLIAAFGLWTYLILFFVIFIETGVVVMPFLPGDSLIFAGAAFAAIGQLNLFLLYITVLAAAVLGDTVNYHIGRAFGGNLLKRDGRLIKKEYIKKTNGFFQRHGGKSIILARFMPIIRTFAPFVAGIGDMHYAKFLFYNASGALLWTALFCLAGFFFGNIPLVRDHFSLVIFAIILISLTPALLGLLKKRKSRGAGQNPIQKESVKIKRLSFLHQKLSKKTLPKNLYSNSKCTYNKYRDNQ